MYSYHNNKDLSFILIGSSIFIFLLANFSINRCENLQEDDELTKYSDNNVGGQDYDQNFGSIQGIFGKVAKTVLYGGATFVRINSRLLCPLLKRETDKDNQEQPVLYVFNNFLERQRAFRIYADDEITPWMIEVAQFDPNQMTFIFVHGWLGGIHNELWLSQAKNTILKVSETFHYYRQSQRHKNKIFASISSNINRNNHQQKISINFRQPNNQNKNKTKDRDYYFNSTSYHDAANSSGFWMNVDPNYNDFTNNSVFEDAQSNGNQYDDDDDDNGQSDFKPNVIIVDWSDFAHGSLYSATQNSFKVSKRLGDLLIQLAEVGNIKPELMHCMGHSIGTHICGQAARYAFPPKPASLLYKKKSLSALAKGDFVQLRHRRMGRITGLDPGGFCYELGIRNETTYLGLKPSDALVVDAYYTNRSPFGNKFLVGQYNVRINNGFFQRPCSVWLNQTTSIDYFRAAVRFTMGRVGNNNLLACDHYFATKFPSLLPYKQNSCSYLAYACDSHRNFLRGRCGLCNTTAQCYSMDFQYQKNQNSLSNKNALEHLQKYSSYFNDLNYNTNNNDLDNYEDGDPSLPLGGVKYRNRRVYYMLITNEEPFCRTMYRIRVNLDQNIVDIGSFRNSWLEIRFFTKEGDLLLIKDANNGKVGETVPLNGPWTMNPEERIFTGVEANTLTGIFSLTNPKEKIATMNSDLKEIKNVVVTYNNRLSRRQDPFANPIESIQIDYLGSSDKELIARNSRLLSADDFKIVYKHLEQTAEMVDLNEKDGSL